MLRIQCLATRRFLKLRRNLTNKQLTRSASGPGGSNQGPNPAALAAAVTTLFAGSTVAYARINEGFRNDLVDKMPSFTKKDWLLDLINYEEPVIEEIVEEEEPPIEVPDVLHLLLTNSEEDVEESSSTPALGGEEQPVAIDTEVCPAEVAGSEVAEDLVVAAVENETGISDAIEEAVADESVMDLGSTAIETLVEPVDTLEVADVAFNADEQDASKETIVPVEPIDVMETTKSSENASDDSSPTPTPDDEESSCTAREAIDVIELTGASGDFPASTSEGEGGLPEPEYVAQVVEGEEASSSADDSQVVISTSEEEVEEVVAQLDEAVAAAPPQTQDPPAPVFELDSGASAEMAVEAIKVLEDEEAMKAAASTILSAFLSRGHSATEVAVDTGSEAKASADTYLDLMRRLLVDKSVSEEEEAAMLAQLADGDAAKRKIVEKAVNLHAIANKEVAQIENVLEHVRLTATTSDSEEIVEAEGMMLKLKSVLDESNDVLNSKIDEMTSLNRVMNFYRKMVGSKPVAFITMPEEEYTLQSRNLSSGEMRQVLALLQDHLEQLQMEALVEQERFDARLQAEMATACEQTERRVREIMHEEMVVKMEELAGVHDEAVAEHRSQHEEEMKHQLKRQAAAHVLHLTDALKYLQDQLDEEHATELKEKLMDQTKSFEETINALREQYECKIREVGYEYTMKVAAAKARVEGLESGMASRAAVDKFSRKANDLSIACEALVETVKSDKSVSDDDDDEESRFPHLTLISHEVETVLSASENDENLRTVVDQIPPEVVKDGVYTESALKDLFKDVGRLCCRLSLVDDRHHSIFSYALSYLKSLVMLSTEAEQPPAMVDVEGLDAFKIVSYANYCLQHGQIEQAARFVNQMRGESRHVADVWLSEVRLHLETLHAVDAISAISSAIIIGSQQEE